MILGGPRLAILRTIEFMRRKIYTKINLSAFIQSKLLVAGPATPLHALYVQLHRSINGDTSNSGVAVMEEDWDNLILLDSYRSDSFENHSSLNGDFSTKVSKGAWSLEFIVNNFQGEQFHDTVVVTSNPYYQRYSKLDQNTFHSIIYTPKTQGIESFDELTEKAIEAYQEFPDKRLIVHYMKPHAPHVGETSKEFKDKFGDAFPGMFMLYRSGVISKQELKKSYVETIGVIEPRVRNLLDVLDGKSIVSSDHGENLGERHYGFTQVGHGNPTTECYRVPWLEIECTERREVTETQPRGFDPADKKAIEESLSDLGYR